MQIYDILKEKLKKYKLPNTKDICENLDNFNSLMLKYNETHNLTSITKTEDVVYKHYIDSLLPEKLIPKNSSIIDLGCGGGFPCIPLKIIRDDLKITAVDSVQKKTNFVSLASNYLSFKDFNVIHSRIEDLAKKFDYRETFDVVISRALAPLPTVIEYSIPFLKKGGIVISYKGSAYKEEIEKSKNALEKLSAKIENVVEYKIDELDLNRYVIIIKKLDITPKKYPRNGNKPRLQPL